MSFSADWLSLRADADARARSGPLIEAAIARLADLAPPVRITDLGSGSGATLRALGPRLAGAQAWTLVDADAALLAHAEPPRPDIAVTRTVTDLMADPGPWDVPPHLVTASALFDLTSRDWIDRFADQLARDRVPLLAFLTFDGRLALSPAHNEDAAMVEAFNTHQRGDKGFGPAAGPDAPAALADALAARGFTVRTDRSDWTLEAPRDRALIAEVLDGWAGAARELGTVPDDAIAAWRSAHQAAEGVLVGHVDLFAVPD